MTSLSVTPFLMFEGRAREAIDLYCATFPDARLVSMDLWSAGEPGPEGTVKQAFLSIAGQTLRLLDSPTSHAFGFTPSISFFVECTSEEQLRAIAAPLEEGGHALMPIDNYGFSRLFTWVADRFGVTWQLNLA